MISAEGFLLFIFHNLPSLYPPSVRFFILVLLILAAPNEYRCKKEFVHATIIIGHQC